MKSYGHFSYIQSQGMAAIFDFKACNWQITPKVVAAILYFTSNLMVKSHQLTFQYDPRADKPGHRTKNYVSTTNTWGVIVILMIFGFGGGHIGFKKMPMDEILHTL